MTASSYKRVACNAYPAIDNIFTAMTIYTVNQFDPGTEKQELLTAWTGSEMPWGPARLEWFCRSNGFAVSKIWVLRGHDAPAVLGSASVMMRPFLVNGKRIMGGINCDLLVSKEHRTLGPALKLINGIKQSAQDDPRFFLAFPNDAARALFKRSGYSELGIFYRWTRLLRSEEILRSRIPNLLIRKVVSSLVDLGSRMVNCRLWLSRLRGHGISSIQERVQTGSFLAGCIDAPIFAERTFDFMVWRYREMPHKRFTLYAVSKNEEIIGYVVCTFPENEVYIDDIVLSDPNLFSEAMMSFLNYAKNLPVRSISIGFLGSSRYEQLLKKLGFIRRDGLPLLIYIRNNDLKSKLLVKDNWFLLRGEIDL